MKTIANWLMIVAARSFADTESYASMRLQTRLKVIVFVLIWLNVVTCVESTRYMIKLDGIELVAVQALSDHETADWPFGGRVSLSTRPTDSINTFVHSDMLILVHCNRKRDRRAASTSKRKSMSNHLFNCDDDKRCRDFFTENLYIYLFYVHPVIHSISIWIGADVSSACMSKQFNFISTESNATLHCAFIAATISSEFKQFINNKISFLFRWTTRCPEENVYKMAKFTFEQRQCAAGDGSLCRLARRSSPVDTTRNTHEPKIRKWCPCLPIHFNG